MVGEQPGAHGACEERDSMTEDLCSWFCQLSTQEKLQVKPVFFRLS